MTKRSLFFFGAFALTGAFTAFRRRAGDVRTRVERERERCERLLSGLDSRCARLR